MTSRKRKRRIDGESVAYASGSSNAPEKGTSLSRPRGVFPYWRRFHAICVFDRLKGAVMAGISEINVNGAKRRVEVDADRSLLSVLRDDLDLTGSKYGCGEGRCGACTVIIDGKAVRSCVTAVGECAQKQVTTIEGLEKDGKLHPLQEAFLHVGAMQCGYCTPGMIMSGAALLSKTPEPTTPEIVKAMDGNICRCGTYGRIIAAVQKAAEALKGGGK
jgi:aerobic-type carbon monoxide dehydrogenase small subunit (CoxS/CutS family)